MRLRQTPAIMQRSLTFLFTSFLLMLGACTPLPQSSNNSGANPKALRLEDATYEMEIKTVRLYPRGNVLAPSTTSLQGQNLRLEFDDLTDQRDTYNARIIHCNQNWTQSALQDLDYLPSYNEFPLNNSEFSVDTHVPYVHYWFDLPPVKLPGNYVLVIYRGTDKEDVVLSRRFMVYDNRVKFVNERDLVGPGAIARLNQQINFTINHSNVDIMNPMHDVYVVIRQNQRWDNAIYDVKPSFVRDIEKELEYRFFDEAKMFPGGNEFRFFDVRSLNNPGRNIAYVNRNVKPYEVYLGKDKNRSDEVYSQYDEMNGNFIIQNYDYQDPTFSNYAWVNFSLQSKPIQGEVYVIGAFNNWNFNNQNRMKYDSAQRLYTSRILLKQGWYDYQYYVKSGSLPTYYYEGSYFETENRYEIFVYYRPFQPRADLLIGYMQLLENAR
jgi:hypothetical protein